MVPFQTTGGNKAGNKGRAPLRWAHQALYFDCATELLILPPDELTCPPHGLNISNRSDRLAPVLRRALMPGKSGTPASACTSWPHSPNRTRDHKGWKSVLPVDPGKEHNVGLW